jgi:hypothetical protein
MTNHVTNIRVMRKLVYFVALSLLVHVWIMYGVPFDLPHDVPAPLVLEARLQPAPPLPPVLPRVRPRLAAKPSIEPVPAAPLPETVAGTASMPEPAPQTPLEPAASEPPADPVAPAPALADGQPVAAPAPLLARRLPRKGQITYELYLGNDRFNVGRTQQSWEIAEDRYRLASVSETTGLAALFSRQRLAYESTGRLTASGLKPEHFTSERVRGGKTEKVASDFDWLAASAAFGDPRRQVALPADAQDIVSFMYQLGLAPLTPGRVALPVTNGWKLEHYELDVGGEEMLETPFGVLRAVPVKQVRRAQQESIELWLAPAYRWLPVRIRFYNREGQPSGEQLVSEIRVSDD